MQPKIKTFLDPKGTNDMAQHKTCMKFNNMHDMIYENSEVDKILTLRANFFNLFIAENCLSRERTLGSRA